ncbi:glycosyltransferase [Roseomonas sp. 18066]|uniref:glycosyltransferase family 2 protein n=1 Tax=Roseomonas sp. 18066 TaxID=2681412 RepID=UPI00135AFCC4|nr:glycosyltransferase [Roseomonas sp. 18066]
MSGALTASVSALGGLLARYPGVRAGLRQALRPALPWLGRALAAHPRLDAARQAALYQRWIAARDTRDEAARHDIRLAIAAFHWRPLISVAMPAYATPPALLQAAIASLQAQLYPDWELCLVDDATPGDPLAGLLSEAAAADPRIRWQRRARNGGIAEATNSALAMARGDVVALMDHDDTLAEHAFFEISSLLQRAPDAAVIYSDEDKIDAEGRRSDPYFKPGFDPDLLLGQNYLNHLTVYRRSLLQRLGGLRRGFDGSQDHDLALRATGLAGAARIHHIPKILYHWRRGGPVASFSEASAAACQAASRAAVAEHLAAQGIGQATVLPAPRAPLWNRVVFPLPPRPPRVSVIIPTRDRAGLLARCVEGLLHRTDWDPLEIIIVDNDSREAATAALLAALSMDPRVTVLRIPGAFNYSALNNAAARIACGDLLLLLNNDIDVLHPDWLAEMVRHATRPEIGAVGARLLYADGRVQHAGVSLGAGGVAGHRHAFARRDDTGYWGSLALTRSHAAVTGACLMLKRAVFEDVGGLDEARLPIAFNDIDLCLRIRESGLRVVCTPFAELLHLESASRGSDRHRPGFQAEHDWMRRRWGDALLQDPYHNRNFSRSNPTGILEI